MTERLAAVHSLEDLFKDAFMRFATTVALITYVDRDDRPSGFTATSLCSVSLVPPALLTCVNRSARSYSEILSRGVFGVNLLAAGQEEIAERCSRPGRSKALPSEWLAPEWSGAPCLQGAIAFLDCTVARTYPESTHSIVVGEIRDIRLGADQEPLVYSKRAYGHFKVKTEDMWERLAFGALS